MMAFHVLKYSKNHTQNINQSKSKTKINKNGDIH